VLSCEGFKMFRGEAEIDTAKGAIRFSGVWLYHPEKRMWYINDCPVFPFGTSFPEEDFLKILSEA